MIKVRVLRDDGWWIGRMYIHEYLYGKFWVAISENFRRAARTYSIKIMMPWDWKHVKKG